MCHFFLVILLRSMSGPTFSAINWSVCMRLKWHFAFAATITTNGGVNWVLVKLAKQIVVSAMKSYQELKEK